MATLITDLFIDRVDLVDEGANSAAFIELYKRKETKPLMEFSEILSKLKPEHAEVISGALADKDAELAKAREDLAAANEELEVLKAKKTCKDCGAELDEDGKCPTCSKSASFDEDEVIKSMPEEAKQLFVKMRQQKEAAEEQVRKAAEEKAETEAVAKAASLKALPIEQDKLVAIVKSCSPEILDLLTAANAAIEASVLDEIGKNKGNGASSETDAWSAIEKCAADIAKRDSITLEKAIGVAISENPDLYREYLKGGAE